MSPSLREEHLRKIPSVDEILSRSEIADLLRTSPRTVVVEAIRKVLASLRSDILNKEIPSDLGNAPFS